MSAPFKIPRRTRLDSDSVQMTSPLSRLQDAAPDQFKGFSLCRDRTIAKNSSSVAPLSGTNSIKTDVKSRLGTKPAEPLTNGWRPKRASDRLLSPVSLSQKKSEERPDSTKEKKSSTSEPSPLRSISVRSLDPLATLLEEQHHRSSATDRRCIRMQETPKPKTGLSWSRVSSVASGSGCDSPPPGSTVQSDWSDLSDIREKQREKWKQFKEKKQNRIHASIRTKNHKQDRIQTRSRNTVSSEPIVLSSEEELEEQSDVIEKCPQPQNLDLALSERLSPPSFLQLDFTTFHMGLSHAEASGRITITENSITIPLRGFGGSEVELCVVATQVQAFGLWDGGVAAGGTLFTDSADCPLSPAPSLLFLSVTNAQSNLLQTELWEILPQNTDPLCCLLLLVLKEQLSDLDSALVLSILDSGEYKTSRSGPGSGLVDWTQGLILIHSCPSPVDSHLLQLLGQQSPVARGSRSGLRSGAQQMPSWLIQYPAAPSKGRLSVSSEDLLCLKQGEFLNDVIIDFYLKYLLLEGVGGAVAERSHVFSSFFYKKLSKRRAAGEDSVASVLDRHTRHQRVKTWTRNVDIFTKDFLFIPVNQEAHWFLVLVCFPGLEEPRHCEFSPNSETVRPGCGLLSQNPPECTLKGCKKNSIVQRPCVLVMDSLKLSYHEAVCRLIRDYLQVEWEVRRGSKRLFSMDTFKTCNCRVPQQDNSTDCGLYLLQYAQAFLQNPIVDFELPVRLETWFPRQQVRNKRQDIRSLVLKLHQEKGL